MSERKTTRNLEVIRARVSLFKIFIILSPLNNSFSDESVDVLVKWTCLCLPLRLTVVRCCLWYWYTSIVLSRPTNSLSLWYRQQWAKLLSLTVCNWWERFSESTYSLWQPPPTITQRPSVLKAHRRRKKLFENEKRLQSIGPPCTLSKRLPTSSLLAVSNA